MGFSTSESQHDRTSPQKKTTITVENYRIKKALSLVRWSANGETFIQENLLTLCKSR